MKGCRRRDGGSIGGGRVGCHRRGTALPRYLCRALSAPFRPVISTCYRCQTPPVVAKLSRKDKHIVKIELEGYAPFEATLTKKVSEGIYVVLVREVDPSWQRIGTLQR